MIAPDILLDRLSSNMRAAGLVQRLMGAFANELSRVEDFLTELRYYSYPHRADDAHGTLAIWEMTLDIPVQAAGRTELERRNEVLARLQARHADEGQDWVAAADKLLPAGWVHKENFPAADQLTIVVPGAPGSVQFGRIEDYLENITPMHLELIITSGLGFVVGESQVGEELL